MKNTAIETAAATVSANAIHPSPSRVVPSRTRSRGHARIANASGTATGTSRRTKTTHISLEAVQAAVFARASGEKQHTRHVDNLGFDGDDWREPNGSPLRIHVKEVARRTSARQSSRKARLLSDVDGRVVPGIRFVGRTVVRDH